MRKICSKFISICNFVAGCFLIFINFYTPFWFSFLIGLISSLIFDIFYFHLWGINFFLFLFLIALEKFLLKIFEKKSIFTCLIIGELLILIYFLGIFITFFVLKQPLPYLNLFSSLLINMLIYCYLLTLFYFKETL
ncbi:MAG: rod shape-determining protein MreD [Minisyncoccia bacterium]